MKTKHLITILSATFTAAGLAAAADEPTNAPATNAPPDQSAPAAKPDQPPATPADTDTNMSTNGVLLNFHDASLNAVLNYLSLKAGLIVVSDPGVNLQGTVSVVAKQPVTTNEIVALLNDQLSKNNYGVLLQGRTLTIMDAERLKTYFGTPVEVTSNYNSIEMNAEIVTAIIPLHTLSAAQLVKDLDLLIPRNDMVTANEAGNAIIMTAPRKDVRRIDQIINDLDGTAFSEVEVSVLKFADSKAVAAELKEIFQSADSDVTRANTRNNFGGGRGGGRGGGMGMMMQMMGVGGGGGGEDTSKNVQTHAVFVSDDQMNAVISAAPPDYMREITNVIDRLDQPNQEVTMIRLFHLKHADPGEVADEIGALFPSATANTDQTRTMGMRFMMPGFMRPQGGGDTQSQRMKLQSTVLIQPDRRTQSVMVTASSNMMEQLEGVIKGLDEGTQGIQQVSVLPIGGADPATVQQALSVLFYSANKPPTTSTTTTSALASRAQANNNNQASTSTTTTTTGLGGGGSGGGLR